MSSRLQIRETVVALTIDGTKAMSADVDGVILVNLHVKLALDVALDRPVDLDVF